MASCLDATASAQPAPSPSPPLQCPVAIAAIAADESGNPLRTDGSEFRMILASPDGPGRVSGRAWINTTQGAYHVSFTDRIALDASFAGPRDPIVFRLPRDAKLENAFIDELDSPTPGPCPIFDAWTPGITENLRAELVSAVRAPVLQPPIAAHEIEDTATACRSGNFPPRTLHAAAPSVPAERPADLNALVKVKVDLGADSEITGTSIYSSTSAFFNRSSIAAARASIFRTRIENCIPVPSSYLYYVEFTASRR